MKLFTWLRNLVTGKHRQSKYGDPVAVETEPPKVELGRWYYRAADFYFGESLIKAETFVARCIFKGYGIWDNIWGDLVYGSVPDFRLATREEIIRMLTAEAVRRGFVEGVKYKPVYSSMSHDYEKIAECVVGVGSPEYFINWDSLAIPGEGGWWYSQGKWAEIKK